MRRKQCSASSPGSDIFHMVSNVFESISGSQSVLALSSSLYCLEAVQKEKRRHLIGSDCLRFSNPCCRSSPACASMQKLAGLMHARMLAADLLCILGSPLAKLTWWPPCCEDGCEGLGMIKD